MSQVALDASRSILAESLCQSPVLLACEMLTSADPARAGPNLAARGLAGFCYACRAGWNGLGNILGDFTELIGKMTENPGISLDSVFCVMYGVDGGCTELGADV